MSCIALSSKIQFIDLEVQQKHIREKIDKAISCVLDHGQYIMGPEVAAFERSLENFCGAKYAISCANGTDALLLALKTKSVKAGQAIFVPSFTFTATAEVVAMLGAEVVFVDVDEHTFNIKPASLKHAINAAQKAGFEPAGIISVDLFGQPADYEKIDAIAENADLWLIVDAAQSFGSVYQGRKTGTIGDLSTTSFFPAKPLGCYGDGGAIFTNDDSIAEMLKSLRVHGQGKNKYDNIHVGTNSRLDTLQAAILIEKLAIFSDEIKKRDTIARRYTERLKDHVETPAVIASAQSVWAQYTIQLPRSIERTEVISALKEQGIPAVIYYPKPLHLQPCYAHYQVMRREQLLCSEEVAAKVLSLPMHPYLSTDAQDHIVDTLIELLT